MKSLAFSLTDSCRPAFRPSCAAAIFSSLDDLILISEGRTVYLGPAHKV